MLKNLPKSSWPREKLINNGVEALRNDELLAILLRVGYKGEDVFKIAQRLMSRYSIANFIQLSYLELIKIKGIGKAQACVVLAAKELMHRGVSQITEIIIQSPKDIQQVIGNLRKMKKEYLVGLYLNARNCLLKKETISIGTLTTSLIHPREVFAPAIVHRAAQVIIVHNHPSGEANPSQADLAVTKSLIEAGKLLDIDLLDHLIVSEQGYFSFKENNLMFSR